MATLKTKIKIRRDTAANLANVVLEIGELAYATDTKKFAIGNGSTKFSELKDYGFEPNLNNFVTGPTNATDNALVRFNGTTGKIVQNSGIIVDDNNNLTTNGIVKIQNGAASGAFVLGADVNATTLTAGQRKLGRMGVPSYDSNGTKTVAGISFDSQPAANYADFGGHPNNAASIAPDVIRFIVANSHDNAANGARTLALQISKQDGLVDTAGGGTSVAAAKFFIPVQATSSITSNEGFIHGGLTAATGKTKNDYILLAGGNTKPISDFAMSSDVPDVSDFVTKSTAQTITGIKTFVGQSVIKSSAATASADNTVNGFKFLTNTGTYVGKIASNDSGAIGFYGKTALYFRPVIGSDGKVDTNYGVTMDNTGLFPGSTNMNLGTSTKPWGSVYGTTYYENGTSLANKYALKTELPTVNDGALTLKASDGVTATQQTFTANDADNVTFEVKHATPTGAAAGSYGPSAGGEQTAKGTLDIIVPQITTDKFGHITGVTNKTFKVVDTDTNTHYTTGLYIGASNTKANAATSNGGTYIKLYDDNTKRSEFKIFGSGATTVASDASGNLTITSTDNDTKNTAGSTNSDSKLFLIGATSQAANPQTYSDSEVYTTNGTLTTNKVQVGNGTATMQYDSTNQCIRFVIA
jgi:hypothetical protein